MLQKQSVIQIKDNSGMFEGRIINANKSNNAGAGVCVKVAIIRAKSDRHCGIMKDIWIIQTKKQMMWKDGSTYAFNSNSGVCVIKKGWKNRITCDFKRINTALGYEHKHYRQLLNSNMHLMKMARVTI